MGKLTDKQRRFVEEYCVDFNATQAAVRAGYSKRTARQIGQENLSKPVIQFAIKEFMSAMAKQCEVSAEKVMDELAAIGFADLSDFITWDGDGVVIRASEDLTAEQVKALESVEIEQVVDQGKDGEESKVVEQKFKVRMHKKLPALTLLGRQLGMFAMKHEHSGPRGGPIEVSEESGMKALEILKRSLRKKK